MTRTQVTVATGRAAPATVTGPAAGPGRRSESPGLSLPGATAETGLPCVGRASFRISLAAPAHGRVLDSVMRRAGDSGRGPARAGELLRRAAPALTN